MNDDTPLSRIATSELASIPIEATAPSDSAQEAAIAAMERAYERRRLARRRRHVLLGCAAAAAAVVGVLGSLRLYRDHDRRVVAGTSPSSAAGHAVTAQVEEAKDSVVVSSDHAPTALAGGGVLGAGDRIVSEPTGHASLVLSTGTKIALQPEADLTVVSAGADEIFELRVGAVGLHVAKLAPGERFVVRTPDAEVEVRGTAFTVSVVPPDPSCGGGTRTRVVVDEGAVVVRSAGAEWRVIEKERWPSCAGTHAFAPAPIAASAPVAAKTMKPSIAPGAPGASAVGAAGASPTNATSHLAAENDLFTEALAAKQRGDAAAALAGFELYLARYPGGRLAENAEVERMRLLSGAEAVLAAREYLARHPSGFAREEAQALVSASH